MNLNFTKPLFISSNIEPDQVKINFNNLDMFSDIYGQPLERSSTELIRTIPKQMPSAAEAAVLNAAKDGVGNGAIAASTFNFILNFLLSGAMQFLWDLINSQQIVILLPLFASQIPANAMVMFGAIMQIAAFDAIPTDPVYEYLELDGKDPINDNFESVGFETILIMHNLGSLALFIALSPLYYIYYFLLGCCSHYKKIEEKRKQLGKTIFWGLLLRLIMESYMIVVICCLINVQQLDWSDDWNSFNSGLSIAFFVIFMAFPILSTLYLYCNWKRTGQSGFETSFGELWAGYSIESKKVLIYLAVDYARKVLMGVAVAVYTTSLFAQYMLLIFTSLSLVAAAGAIHIYDVRSEKTKIIINELVLMVMMYHILTFTDWVPNPETRYKIGYSLIGCLACGLLYNMQGLIIQTYRTVVESIRNRYARRLALKYLNNVTRKRDKKGRRKIDNKAIVAKRDKIMTKRKKDANALLMDLIDTTIKGAKLRRAIRRNDYTDLSASMQAK